MTPRTAICYLLANPAPERPVETLQRHGRAWLGRLPVVGHAVVPRWSPARRNGFGAGLKASVQSLRHRHASLPPVLVLRPPGQGLPLADVDDVVTFDPAPYASIPQPSSYFGRETYYKLEVCNVRGYDRVVYLDCDTLVLGDISPLWDMGQYSANALYAVRETAEMGVHPARIGRFNLGVMVVNKPLLSERVHRELVAIAARGESSDRSDQGVMEHFWGEKPALGAGDLDASYNVMVRAKRDGRWERFADRIRILHFTNFLKPWLAAHRHDPWFDADFLRLWIEAFGAVAEPPAAPPVEQP
jgi:hypothetical protein